ncbi:hypothetical protein [Amycolatopsis sp. PS_44_ISF1]|uniref:hypothetical protein n=1 Tax=Amycolatopsis sp. PS_44_ISF1 TaxID=2974917 RepID=UPI0028DD848D|nr:hypothetical protein [Amycolatopsis sp. PS_44_ISF1]MDT8915229.1 hypothetical protein [Amycolatopsis sp. PS_44_ISF1]
MNNSSLPPRMGEIGPWVVTARRTLLLLGVTAGFVFLAALLASGARADERPASDPPASAGSGGKLVAPVAAVLRPVTDGVASAVKPVASALRPVTGALAPVVSDLRPVTAPVAESVGSVLRPVTAVVEPITSALRPVTEPVVAIVRPVVTPVAGAPKPVTKPVANPAAAPVVSAVAIPQRQPEAISPRADFVAGPAVVPAAHRAVPTGSAGSAAVTARPEGATSRPGQGVPPGPFQPDTAFSTGTATLSDSGQHGGMAAIVAVRPGVIGAWQRWRAPPAGAWPPRWAASGGENRPG